MWFIVCDLLNFIMFHIFNNLKNIFLNILEKKTFIQKLKSSAPFPKTTKLSVTDKESLYACK